MNRLFLKVFLFFFLSIHIFSCWSNPYAPFNFVECDDGNINGKNEKVCKLKKKMTLFTNGFYLFLSTKTDSGADVTSHTISGIISNPNDNTPYTNHSLTVQPNNLTTTTDTNGNYTFSLPAGTYTITIKDANGNTIGTLTLIVSSGGGVSVSVSTGVVKMTANGVTGVPDTVATPTFSVASGTYNTDQSISITCATSDVTIFYTTDNSTPATSVSGSTSQYSSAISVSGHGTSRTIKAIAVKSGMVNSVVASGSWTIDYDVVATPTFSPTAGTYNSDQSISISTTTSGATIYYTIDNSTPTTSVSGSTLQYSSTISVSGNGTSRTIKAIAFKSGMVNSAVAIGSWVIDSTIPTVTINAISSPYLSNNAGAINSKDITWSSNRNGTYSVRVGGTNCTDGTQLLNGSTTASASNTNTINASSISVGSNTIRICVTDSFTTYTGNSTTTLTRDDTAPTVLATPSSATSSTLVNVTLSCSDASSGCEKIAYSTGTDPSINGVSGAITNGTQYTSQLSPTDNGSTTYKFSARDNAGNVSSVQSGTYTIDTSVSTVSINTVSATTIDASTNPVLNWQANEGGTYTIKLGGTNCSDGTLATGTNVSGTALTNTAISTNVNNSAFSSGANTVRLCVANLVGNYGSVTQGITKDVVAPVAGNSGTITTSSVASTSLTLNWTAGTDTYTTQENLQYKVVMSTTNNISTVSNAETNGTLKMDWTTNTLTYNVTGLTTGQTYYFNVLVKDGMGNKALYVTKSETTRLYTIGGGINGLTSSGLVLRNNGGDSLSVALGISSFTFNTSMNEGSTYSVTIQTQPTGLYCSIINAAGTVSGDVTNISIICSCTGTNVSYSWGTFTDCNNGVVRFTGSGSYNGSRYAWKKCSQGQIFNLGTNSCDGVPGTYQFCSTNNGNCNNNTANSQLVSPFYGGSVSSAYNSCNSIGNYNGYSGWYVPSLYTLKTLIHCTDKTMPNYPNYCGTGNFTNPTINSLFPNTSSSTYWTSDSHCSWIGNLWCHEEAWAINFSSGFANNVYSKTNLFNLRCMSVF